MPSRSPRWAVPSDLAARGPGLRVAFPIFVALAMMPASSRAGDDGVTRFGEEVQPILADYCYGCHGLGAKKGQVSLDEFASDEAALRDRELWHAVLKNVRAGIMPPAGKPRPSAEEMKTLEDWIKRDVFQSDPKAPDPGRVTLRRLNRVEYRNTIRDLMGIDFRTDEEFPADDAGYGFDNIGDVLTVSPLLLEKYMQAAETIVATAVPTVPRAVQVHVVKGSEFRGAEGAVSGRRMSFYRKSNVSHALKVGNAGRRRLVLELEVDGTFNPEPGRCRLVFSVDGRELAAEDFSWHDNKEFRFECEDSWGAGEHRLALEVRPLVPAEQMVEKLDILVHAVRVEGPLDEKDWGRPKNFERFFDRDPPESSEGRHSYAREVLGRFASRAFRRPVDERTVDRLVAIAEGVYSAPGKTVQQGIAQAMVAVLASPRFLFLLEKAEPGDPGRTSSPIDEFALASRLSYFLWSTMPDEELVRLAGRGELRKGLKAQVDRMLADPRSKGLVENFIGQWLQVRDVEHFPIQARQVLRRDGLPRIKDSEVGSLRRAMKMETESYFAHVIREDRSLLDLIDSDYTFVDEQLARHYGIPGVTGDEFRRVALPEGNPRGGLLTQAGVLMVTSNPTRTSPVKRGQFILENFLGTPTPPPPPDIPELEAARKGFQDREPTVREMMALHASQPLCASCHSRMDPLGLALENFNALGMWREAESKQPIDASGTLLSGRSFKDIRGLKAILKGDHRRDFYRCLTEKMLTYALGRGIEYHDVETVDGIVGRLEEREGRFSALLMGIIESSPFQKRRNHPQGPPNGTKP